MTEVTERQEYWGRIVGTIAILAALALAVAPMFIAGFEVSIWLIGGLFFGGGSIAFPRRTGAAFDRAVTMWKR